MKNTIRRFFACLLCAALIAGVIVPAAAADDKIANTFEMKGTRANNASDNTYVRWSAPVKSYLGETDGKLVRVEYVKYTEGRILYERYEKDGTLLSTGTIPMELQEFGGFFFGQTYNFAVFGRKNLNEKPNEEVLRVVKYDKEMNKLGACSYYGENTYSPFDAGSLRMAETGGKLYIHTCHEMFKSQDGKNHQANMYFCIDEETMTDVDKFTGVMDISYYGYVSQSFNQFIATDGTYVFRADHGDTTPRGIALTRFSVSAETAANTVSTVPLVFAGKTGAYSTGATLGGMALSNSRVLLAGSIDDQTGEYTDYTDIDSTKQKNIFVISAAKTLAADQNKVVYITNYAKDAGITVGTPHLTALGNGTFLLLWEETAEEKLTVRAVIIDENGSRKTEIYRIQAKLSDCAPILASDGAVYWYVGTNLLEVLYRLDPKDIGGFEYSVHYWDNGVVTTPAGCETKGVKTFTCLDCGITKTDPIQPAGHSWGPWMANADGKTHTRVCTRDSSHIENGVHSYGEAKVLIAATCTSPGVNGYYCTACTAEKTEPVAALNHKWGPWTYFNAMRHQRVCLNDANHTELADHVWKSGKVSKAPTCEEEGVMTFECGDCSGLRTEPIQPLGHTWDVGTVTTEPGCETRGERTYTCKTCGKTRTEPIEPNGHKYTSKETPPTCTEEGYTTYTCGVCGHSYKANPTAAKGHTWDKGVITTAPGCLTYGEKTFTCTVCKETRVETVPPTNHIWDKGTPEKPATCTEKGVMIYTCTVCGVQQKGDILPKGHTWNEGEVSAPPTCEVIGVLTVTCTVCGETEIRSIPPLGHKYEKTVTPPTCTEQGFTTHTCANCGNSYTTDPVPALSHSWKETDTVAPTCTENGARNYVCERCGMTYTEVLDAGHTWDEGEVTQSPTCTEAGELLHTCTVCGEKETVELPANGHTFGEWVEIEPATETREGSAERVCTVCGAWETKVLPMLEPEVLPGDVNRNGFVTSADARLVLRRAVGLETYAAGSPEYLACDVNHDGFVTAADARLVLRAAVGLTKLS